MRRLELAVAVLVALALAATFRVERREREKWFAEGAANKAAPAPTRPTRFDTMDVPARYKTCSADSDCSVFSIGGGCCNILYAALGREGGEYASALLAEAQKDKGPVCAMVCPDTPKPQYGARCWNDSCWLVE